MSAPTQTESFVHPALFYRGSDEYLAGTVPFVREGLDAGDAVAVAVPGANLERIRDALGERAEQVRLLDMSQVGRNPGRIIPRVLRAFADAHPGRRARIIGEPVWAGRTPTEYPACAQHEALINLAFQGREATILCPYDEAGLAETVLADAHATHPTVIRRGRTDPSAAYAPDAVVSRYNQPLTAPDGVPQTAYARQSLSDVRHLAILRATELGMPAARLQDFALVVSELTTNSVVHGGGSGALRVWAENGHVVCEVHDAGVLTDPLAGRRSPAKDQYGGRGLLMVHVLTDLVRVHTDQALGTTTHCYFRCA
ncbi:anti-sigma regulatory factor [Streptomyces venezuelae]|uniref:Anti-sigma regulatory factor n=1 Tax=Streptomyces venezuelae TaxID=54571 RepID=A0A5P2BS44_STRVZ|nr:anti-sigma factor RsbA family regulatory protein [Streptomyces venezuelae]QES33292.1 anti-sigma regulatory factor [Streptomyces venezuelae]